MTSRLLLLTTAVLLVTTGCALHTDPNTEANLPSASAWSAGEPPLAQDPLYVAVEPSPAPPDLWQRLTGGFSLPPNLDRKRVQQELDWYRRNPEYLARVIERAEPHLHFIMNEVEARNMPMEFALLPAVESAFDPFAYSHGRASGLWQFIPGTARLYGLKIDWWYDARRDVYNSTHAALDYLQDLNKQFDGNWLIALASYNVGPGNMRKAIMRNKSRQRPADFWSLSLPRETQQYVPKLLAFRELILNHEAYDIDLPAMIDTPTWNAVSIDSQIDLARAAELAGIPLDDLHRLNPAYNQWATHPDGPHRLLIPAANVDEFEAGVAALPPKDRLTWQQYTIQPGDTLGQIASAHRVTVATLKDVNHLRSARIVAGDELLIPVASEDASYRLSATGRQSSSLSYYKNKYQADPVYYQVKPGDSLWDIAREYDVSVRTLAKWNQMGTTSTLKAGTRLAIFVRAASPTTSRLRPEAREVIRRVSYQVRRGENLSLIADKFNLTVGNIHEWNEEIATRKYLKPGDQLTLYVNVIGTE